MSVNDCTSLSNRCSSSGSRVTSCSQSTASESEKLRCRSSGMPSSRRELRTNCLGNSLSVCRCVFGIGVLPQPLASLPPSCVSSPLLSLSLSFLLRWPGRRCCRLGQSITLNLRAGSVNLWPSRTRTDDKVTRAWFDCCIQL